MCSVVQVRFVETASINRQLEAGYLVLMSSLGYSPAGAHLSPASPQSQSPCALLSCSSLTDFIHQRNHRWLSKLPTLLGAPSWLAGCGSIACTARTCCHARALTGWSLALRGVCRRGSQLRCVGSRHSYRCRLGSGQGHLSHSAGKPDRSGAGVVGATHRSATSSQFFSS